MKEIGPDAFCKCEKLTRVMFAPESKLEVISAGSFRNSGLESVEIPSGVTLIGGRAFEQCKELRSVLFTEGSRLEKLETECFCGTGVEELEIPSSITVMEEGAF